MPFEMDSTISIHAPCEGGDASPSAGRAAVLAISIHAPREGGRRRCSGDSSASGHFNPRPPRGGRPHPRLKPSSVTIFQSTPPARGATYLVYNILVRQRYFNPRPPRGGATRWQSNSALPMVRFQSTPPVRGATIQILV